MKISNWEMKESGECFFCHVSEEELNTIMAVLGGSHEIYRILAERKVRLALKNLEQQVDKATRFDGNLRCGNLFKKADFDLSLQKFCIAFDEFLKVAEYGKVTTNEEN